MESDDAPILVTLALDDAASAFFAEARRRWYPRELDRVPAHVALFHRLPGASAATILDDARAVAEATAAFDVTVVGVRSLGRGVAYGLAAAPLNAVRAALAARWRNWLVPQDRQGFRPHVVVQNKVDAETASATLAALAAAPHPATIRAEGLDLWRYLGGPWASAARCPFRSG